MQNNIHYVRAAVAVKPSAEEIKAAIERANSKWSNNKGRRHEVQVYTK